MEVANILKYGLYDSKHEYANKKITQKRVVNVFEFDYIISCNESATSFIDGKSFSLAPNTLIIRKPNQICNSKLHFKCYCLHLEIPKDSPLYSELLNTPNFYTFISDKTYQTLFESLFEHLIKQENFHSDYFVNAKILELIYHVKKDGVHNQNAKANSLKKENKAIQNAITFIKQNYQEEVTLKSLGKLTGYSPNHFQRIFTLIIGVSPQSYLESVRINQSKYLLTNKELSISDIAYSCGFSSQSYFCKVFKKHTLLTPYEFRQKSQFKY